MPKKALWWVILVLLICPAAIAVLYHWMFDDYDPYSFLSVFGLPLGITALILAIMKIPPEQRTANFLARVGRDLGLLGFALSLVMSFANPGLRESVIRRKVAHDQNSLRNIGTALEAYYSDWSHFPPDLRELTVKANLNPPISRRGSNGKGRQASEIRPYIEKIPDSPFDMAPPRYFTFHDRFWIAWYPGPDKKSDIDPSAHIKEIDEWIGHDAAMPNWVLVSLYDPTNGTISRGDVIRGGGARVEARAFSSE